MLRTHLSLDAETLIHGKELFDRYGPSASFSAIVRRAVALLYERWEEIGENAEAKAAECEKFTRFAGSAQRWDRR